LSKRLHIGTSGWHYKHWRGPFYPANLPAEQMLDFYVQKFDSVEINNSFYRLPIPGALKNWRDNTPKGFEFAVKGSRYLTHMKKLKDPKPGLKNFFSRIKLLGNKLGPIVFQLPPRFECNSKRLETFLVALPKKRRYSFEFRDPTWHRPEIYKLLERHNAAYCIYELAGFQSPIEVTADFVYIRLHGPSGPYQGLYTKKSLAAWASRIEKWRHSLKQVYIYFDNDQAGYAARNALELKTLLESV
jgi:uncharacterized protein YecE (DUF72 family)